MEILDLLKYLLKLTELDRIEIYYLPEPLHKDILTFTNGDKIYTKEKYLAWLNKLDQKGWDYDIDVRNEVTIPKIPNLFKN